MTYRSTKGASKQRRDAINDRISQIRELLPVSEMTRGRLSQLQVMTLTNSYVAKSNFFSEYCCDFDDRSSTVAELFDFTQSLPGFLLIAGVDGRILYISENVSDYLGSSAVDVMTQMESIYDVIDERDRHVLRQAMTWQMEKMSSTSDSDENWLRDVANESRERSDSTANELTFMCRLNSVTKCVRNGTAQLISKTSFDNVKTIQMSGRFIRPRSLFFGTRLSQHSARLSTVFVAHCTPQFAVSYSSSAQALVPLVDVGDKQTEMMDTLAFRSLHGLDMKYVMIEENGEFHLDCDRRAVFGKSWYEMIHPEDMEEAQLKHMEIVNSYQMGDVTVSRSLCVRMQTCTGRSLWLHVVMRINSTGTETEPDSFFKNASCGRHAMIVCSNRVINEAAALFLRVQEVEMTSTKDVEKSHVVSVSHLSTDDELFEGVQLPPFYGTASNWNHYVQHNSKEQEQDERERMRRQLKRKIFKRQHEREKDAQDMKLMKLDEAVAQVHDQPGREVSSFLTSLCSMPSPPMYSWDYNASPASSGCSEPQSCHSSTITVRESWSPDNNDFGATAAGTDFHAKLVPESYSTPSHSPAQMNHSSVAVEDLFDLADFIKRYPEDDSFFGATSDYNKRYEDQKNVVSVTETGIRTAKDFPILPELDHRSIASILGDLELPVLSPDMYLSVSEEFDCIEPLSHRQQFASSRMASVGTSHQQVVESGGVVVPERYPQNCLAYRHTPSFSGNENQLEMETEYGQSQNGVIVDELLREPLIANLFSLAGDFLQNLGLDGPNNSIYHHHQFDAPTSHFDLVRFQGAATSCFN